MIPIVARPTNIILKFFIELAARATIICINGIFGRMLFAQVFPAAYFPETLAPNNEFGRILMIAIKALSAGVWNEPMYPRHISAATTYGEEPWNQVIIISRSNLTILQ